MDEKETNFRFCPLILLPRGVHNEIQKVNKRDSDKKNLMTWLNERVIWWKACGPSCFRLRCLSLFLLLQPPLCSPPVSYRNSFIWTGCTKLEMWFWGDYLKYISFLYLTIWLLPLNHSILPAMGECVSECLMRWNNPIV